MKVQKEDAQQALVQVTLSVDEAQFIKNMARYYRNSKGGSPDSRAAATRLVNKLGVSVIVKDAKELFK